MTFNGSLLLVDHVEAGKHRLIIGDTFRIVTFDQANQARRVK